MKLYISADIEGVCGICHWHETSQEKADYKNFAEQMTSEVKAACEGAMSGGTKELWVQDAHGQARNIKGGLLPEKVKFIRGWAPNPYLMLQELDKTFDGVIMIGYHARAGSGDNPLSHSLNSDFVNYIKINERFASEFLIHAYTAATLNIPVIFLSGDKAITEEVKEVNSNIETVAVNQGVGGSVISIHPGLAVKLIKEGVKKALSKDILKCNITLPDKFKVEISFKKHIKAYKNSFYPGMKKLEDTKLLFETTDFYDVMRMFLFTLFT